MQISNDCLHFNKLCYELDNNNISVLVHSSPAKAYHGVTQQAQNQLPHPRRAPASSMAPKVRPPPASSTPTPSTTTLGSTSWASLIQHSQTEQIVTSSNSAFSSNLVWANLQFTHLSFLLILIQILNDYQSHLQDQPAIIISFCLQATSRLC